MFHINVEELVLNNEVIDTSNMDQAEIIAGLQTALINGKCASAHSFLDSIEDVNYMVNGSLEGWEMPLLHFAIQQTMMVSRFPRPAIQGPKNDGVLFQEHLSVLERIIEMGADMSAQDTYGNLPIMRSVLDALAIDLSITDDEFDEDLEIVFTLLIDNGADPREKTKTRQSVMEMFKNNDVLNYFPK